MFPWFIWKEIIRYAVDYKYSNLCLVNKEWFEASAGMFLHLSVKELASSRNLPRWYKLAENLHIDSFRYLNWEYLNQCTQLKNAVIDLTLCFEEYLPLFKSFVWGSKLNTICFIVEHDSYLDSYVQLLEGISKQVLSLELILNCDSYGSLLALDYLALKELTVRKFEGVFDLDSFHKYMPDLETLDLNISCFCTLPLTSGSYTFLKLKSLKIHRVNYSDFYSLEKFTALFKCRFPNLESFTLEGIYCDNLIESIPQIMPKLKKIDLNIIFKDSVKIMFPIDPLYHLEELCFSSNSWKTIFDKSCGFDIERIQLDLAKVPQLRKLDIAPELKLVNPLKSHRPLIEHINFRYKSTPDSKKLYMRFDFLHEISIQLILHKHQCQKLFPFCKAANELTLSHNNITSPSTLLTPGPFKSSYLNLTERFSLVNEFVTWLAQGFQFTVVETKKSTILYFKLNPVSNYNLKKLENYYQQENTFTYLQSLLLLPAYKYLED